MPLLPLPGRVVLPLLADEAPERVAAGGFRSAVLLSSGRLRAIGLVDAQVDEEEIDDDADDGADEAEEAAPRRPRVRLAGTTAERRIG